ncbi:MAG: Tfp pilus assembly protein FimT [uncultured Paraburkholderia sp.]|nr:MAG: Tfp pilus assembly protein FimT [uncultured Paraburkholderia sp.]CAH2920575.1 MAG: Tfp pilus assembly protein FimT [uncultured Paraburkholderia sp.]
MPLGHSDDGRRNPKPLDWPHPFELLRDADEETRRFRGFTLVETLVVIALLASTLSYARSEALRRGARVTVCRLDSARHCLAAGQPCGNGVTDWSCGWAVMAERGSTSTLLRAQPSLAAVSIVGAQTNLTFTPPVGQLIGAFRSFDIALRAPSRATQDDKWKRCIRVAVGGRARVTEGACGAMS